ncbi:helix-hairpin-helix domain-containing protein [Kitasatospora sp. NPDC057223]|uniref:helix-hairpin-helix domain-containing protein n=1 Tax=Kitasatospora sp. NPDC057223 TaxID=3346055 RepID=UPI003625AD10
MRTLTPGAAKRRETAETVRGRLTHLLAIQPPAGDLPPGGPPAPPGEPPGEPPEVPPGGEPEPVPPPEPEQRPPAPVLRPAAFARPVPALDRRAVLALAVLLLLALAYAVQHFWLGRPRAVQVPVAATATISSEPGRGAGPEPAVVVVDIAGRVPSPGVRALPAGSRVADALRVAGGALPDTDTKQLNLARVLTDGEQVLVGEPAPPPSGGPAPGSPVSLNHATPEQLDTLPGVGPTLAQRIIAFRQAHGSFRSLDQLRQVSGIGARTYDEMKPLLTL